MFSPEFVGRNLCDSDFVEQLYKAMMGRASDQGGKNDWLNRLASGWMREMLFDGFAGFQEFINIRNSYGFLRDSNMILGILGTYESTFDIADKMIEEMDASMSSDGTNIGISFGDYMNEFKQNGIYKQYVDMNVLRASYENMKAALKLYMENAIFELLKQSINAQDPWANIRSKKDLEKYFGMTFDQIIYESLGMDLETYVRIFVYKY